MNTELEQKPRKKKMKEKDALGPNGEYLNRELVFVKVGLGAPKSDLNARLLPHISHLRCTKEFAFNMGLVTDKDVHQGSTSPVAL